MTRVIRQDYLDPKIFESPNWYRAATLSERASGRRGSPRQVGSHDLSRGNRVLRAWRNQPPFQSGTSLARRLRTDHLDESGLLRLLSEPAEMLRDQFPARPHWLVRLEEAYGRYAARRTKSLHDGRRSMPVTDGFLAAFEPLFQQGRERLQERARQLARPPRALPFDHRTVQDLFLPGLAHRLSCVSSRTMVLELHVARLRGLLEGASSEARFDSFVELTRDPEFALSILEEYPVLARSLMVALEQWVRFSADLLERLTEDWDQLMENFCEGENPGPLTRLESGVGDTHRGGSSVAVLHFKSGFQIVYKPRSLGVDHHFQQLLGWINRSGGPSQFRLLKVLDHGSHGWMEFVEPRGCRSRAAVGRFYQRQGAYLALLHSLLAADIHAENLIASGEHPFLVDLEGLFHPRVPGTPDGNQPASNAEASLLEVGLLPIEIWGSPESRGIDLSGLGHRPGQISPFEVPQWEEAGRDTMHLGSRRIILGSRRNRPTLNGRDVEPVDYAEAVAHGFASMYGWLTTHKEELLSREGPLASFAGDEVRFIARPTQVYAELLDTSYHPDALRDALDRDRHLDLLWMQASHQPHLERLIPLEREDLIHGDIPIFTARTDSRHLWSSSGEVVPDFFTRTSMEQAHERLRKFGAADLAALLETIRSSLARNAA